MKDIFLVVLVVILIWTLWFFGGKPSPDGTKRLSFFGTDISSPSIGATSSPSLFKDEVQVSNTQSARESDINREHLGITASYSNSGPVSLTGWKLKNKEGRMVQIGKAAKLPYSGRANTEESFFGAGRNGSRCHRPFSYRSFVQNKFLFRIFGTISSVHSAYACFLPEQH